MPIRAFQTARRGDLKRMSFTPDNKRLLYYGNGLMLWGMALITVLVWHFQERKFEDLGFDWGALPFSLDAWLILIAFVVLYGADALSETGSEEKRNLTKEHFLQNVGFLPANAVDYTHFIFLALTAGICEEIVFRGYFINYFQWWFEDWSNQKLAFALVILLPAISFGITHLYQGWKAVLKIVAMAVLFGAFFLMTGTLWPIMIIHVVVDLVGGLVSWRLLDESLDGDRGKGERKKL